MAEAHAFLGWAAIALAVAVFGVASWSAIAARRSGGRVDHRFAVDRAILATLFVLGVAGLVGVARLLAGTRPADPLHLLYGPAALITLPIAVGLGTRASRGRTSRLRRDVWMAAGAVVLLGIGARLIATG
jgi:hypothetical protein